MSGWTLLKQHEYKGYTIAGYERPGGLGHPARKYVATNGDNEFAGRALYEVKAQIDDREVQ